MEEQNNYAQKSSKLNKDHLTKFSIVQQLNDMMNKLSYTQNQAKDLGKALIKGIISLQQLEPENQKEEVRALLDQNTAKILNGELLYYGMLDKYKEKTDKQISKTNAETNQETKISQSTKSRIYHTIANLKKEKYIKEWYRNGWGINCIKDNGYNKLSESQLQQVVKYQSIADKTRHFGQKINFKYQSIKQQSERMTLLLEKCMSKYIETINQMNYDLSYEEVMRMAQISFQACNYNENGVYILLVYLVKSCERLEKQLKSVQQIEILVKQAVENVCKKYPVGKDLSQERNHLEFALKSLQIRKLEQNKFKYETIQLIQSNKQSFVESIIIQYAKLAEQYKQDFEQLVKETCFGKCVSYKTELRHNPHNPNEKALSRIKSTMFLKGVQWKGEMEKSINETLEKEQTVYRSKIDQFLSKEDKVKFNISDMVRGKCVFLQVEDIVQAVNSIKKFVKENPKFQIEQIESRFTNQKIPASDMTLKIVINKKIVAELQLTIQANVAAYSFHHIMYQIQRNEVFSKLKNTHNYFQELKKDFCQLTKKAIELQPTTSIISQYCSSKSFCQILQESIQQNKKNIKQLVVSVDPLLQDLIIVSFNISINLWGKDIGRIINKALKNEKNSPKLKSVVLSIFLDKLQLINESQSMQLLGILAQQLKQQKYLEKFMKDYFEIQHVLRYVKENQKTFHRAQQLQQIMFYQDNDANIPIQLRNIKFVDNLVIEQHSFQKALKLKELLSFYYITRKEDNSLYQIFQCYSNWIQNQLNFLDNDKNTNRMLLDEIQIIKAQQMLEKQMINEAKDNLLNNLIEFRSREQHSKVMQCQVLLAQCFIKSNERNIQGYIEYYNDRVIKQSQILGLQLKGTLYADSLWRISNYLWPKFQGDQNVRAKLLKYFTTMAIQQMSRSKGKQFIYALIDKWKQFDNLQKKPQIKINPNVRFAKLRHLQQSGCQYLIKAHWSNITTIDLRNNNVGENGCLHLSKAGWKNITTLNLRKNNIGENGCLHLSKADWKNINSLELYDNNIRENGCLHLSKADWKNITTLNLGYNNIGDNGCLHLSKADWKNITILNLRNNNIRENGCLHLSKADWKNITTLNLSYNNIGDNGCLHLSKADWKNITILNLRNNNIAENGCLHLSKADWKNITSLELYGNNIGENGCLHLSKADWKNITTLNLQGNNIGENGCLHLSKADWKNITSLEFYGNNIRDNGCLHLSKTDWKNITTLNLYGNNIGDNGCLYLSKADWKNITTLSLYYNNIAENGCLYLSKGDWKNITTFNLGRNNIGDNGCLHLMKAGWKNISTLNLDYNNIGENGCLHLSNADWKNITTLNLGNNNIGENGCLHLRKAGWNNITTFRLDYNNIREKGCLHLSKAGWKNITTLNLDKNNIGDNGCLHLSKANWKNITSLELYGNNIGENGCLYLSKADWKNITALSLYTNNIGQNGCYYFCILNWKQLKELNLRGNKIPQKLKDKIRSFFNQRGTKIDI